MYNQFFRGRADIQKRLSEEEIIDLAQDDGLEAIQFSEEVEQETFQMLNDLLFSIRDDVVLRAFGW